MGLTVREISDRAERFTSALLEELFDGMSGQKSWPELAPLYESQSVLAWEETAPVIERALAGATGDDERRLRRLLGWAAEHQVRSDNAELDDEYRHWNATAYVELEDSRIRLDGAGRRGIVRLSCLFGHRTLDVDRRAREAGVDTDTDVRVQHDLGEGTRMKAHGGVGDSRERGPRDRDAVHVVRVGLGEGHLAEDVRFHGIEARSSVGASSQAAGVTRRKDSNVEGVLLDGRGGRCGCQRAQLVEVQRMREIQRERGRAIPLRHGIARFEAQSLVHAHTGAKGESAGLVE